MSKVSWKLIRVCVLFSGVLFSGAPLEEWVRWTSKGQAATARGPSLTHRPVLAQGSFNIDKGHRWKSGSLNGFVYKRDAEETRVRSLQLPFKTIQTSVSKTSTLNRSNQTSLCSARNDLPGVGKGFPQRKPKRGWSSRCVLNAVHRTRL